MVRFTFQCKDKQELFFPLQILTTAYEYRSDKMNDTCILIGWLSYMTIILHVAVDLYSNRLQKMSK